MQTKQLKIIALVLCLSLFFEQTGLAQVVGQVDLSGHLSRLHSSLIQDKFRPLHLRYLAYDNLNNNFKLLLDKGDAKDLQGQVFEDSAKELLKHFFVGIALPNSSFWVNLRPDSPDNIIDDYLAQTDVGRILLEADLQLKKDTALATSPQTPEGKQYWDRLYKKAGELLGNDNITIPTLTRPWIVPGEIIVRESQDNVYIYKATLKVMLEQDYLKDSVVYNFKDPRVKALNEYSTQLIKELIIPKLTKEINTSKRYASLRQVYYSLILAQWFKARFYGKSGAYSRAIDKKDLTNLVSKDMWSKTTYFKQYQDSFKNGEYNLKETIQTPYGQTIRSYFSGGISFDIGKISSSPMAVGSVIKSGRAELEFIRGNPRRDAARSAGHNALALTASGLDKIGLLGENMGAASPVFDNATWQWDRKRELAPFLSREQKEMERQGVQEVGEVDLQQEGAGTIIQIEGADHPSAYYVLRVNGDGTISIWGYGVNSIGYALVGPAQAIQSFQDTTSPIRGGTIKKDEKIFMPYFGYKSNPREAAIPLSTDEYWRDGVKRIMIKRPSLASSPVQVDKLKIFTGELAQFTHAKKDNFSNTYTKWLERELTPQETADIKRFAPLLENKENRAWRSASDARDGAKTLGELRDSLVMDDDFPGNCIEAAEGALRILTENGFSAQHIRRQDPVTGAFHSYVEAQIAGETLIIDLAADFIEMGGQPVMGFPNQDKVGIVIIPKRDLALYSQLSVYTQWDIQPISEASSVASSPMTRRDFLNLSLKTTLAMGLGMSWQGLLEAFGGDMESMKDSIKKVEYFIADTSLEKLKDLCRAIAPIVGEPSEFFMAIIIAESVARQGAVSKKGAIGLMQLMPETITDLQEYIRDLNSQAKNKTLVYPPDAYNYNIIKQILALVGPGPYDPVHNAAHNLAFGVISYARIRTRLIYSEIDGKSIKWTEEPGKKPKDFKSNSIALAFYNWGEKYVKALIRRVGYNCLDYVPEETRDHRNKVWRYYNLLLKETESNHRNTVARARIGEFNKNYYPILAASGFEAGDLSASSPAQAGVLQDANLISDKGGIDFRSLPIVTQPVVSNMRLPASGLQPGLPIASNINLEQSWQEIEKMLQAGITPSTERIKEYLAACIQKEAGIDAQVDKVLGCIADILRLEEERCQPTDAALKELLVLLESDNLAKEIAPVINNAALPKEPQPIRLP